MKIGLVLVNWNSGQLTLECLRSIYQGTVVPDCMVVVDNGSIDGSAEAVAVAFTRVELKRNTENLGFAAANNQGVRWLLEQGCDYIWVLNNDTVVHAKCLEKLAHAANRWPDVAGFSGLIYYESPRDRVWYAGAYRHAWHGNVIHRSELLPGNVAGGMQYVEFISGCCMFVPAWAWRQHGMFLDALVAYCEDSEWCWRVMQAGGQFVLAPKAVLWHKLSASVRKNLSDGTSRAIPPQAQYLMVRNQLWILSLHCHGLALYAGLAVNVLIHAKNVLIAIATWDWVMAISLAKGLRDGLKGYPN